MEKAVAYAKKERDVERYCVGTETAHLKKDMKGAKYWLNDMLAERERVRARESKGKAEQERSRKKDVTAGGKKKSGKGRKGEK